MSYYFSPFNGAEPWFYNWRCINQYKKEKVKAYQKYSQCLNEEKINFAFPNNRMCNESLHRELAAEKRRVCYCLGPAHLKDHYWYYSFALSDASKL